MASPVLSPFGTILLSLKARLMRKLNFPTERVLIVARQVVPHLQGMQDVLLWISGGIALQAYSDGAGGYDTRVRRIVHVIPRVNSNRDVKSSDEIWLTASDGILALEDAILNALQVKTPFDSQSNALTDEPVRLINSELPQKEAQGIRDAASGQWGFSTMAFEVVWMPVLDPKYDEWT